MKSPKLSQKALNGLTQLATKYTAKALGVGEKLVKVMPQAKSLLVAVQTSKYFDNKQLERLTRVLRSKDLKLNNLDFKGSLNKSQKHTKLVFELKLIKQTRKPQTRVQSEIQEMEKSQLLADSLAQNMRFSQITANVDKILVQADGNGMGIRVFKHGDGARLIQQLYQDYVSDRDFTGFLDFFKTIDDATFKFRGNKELDLSQLDNEDDDDSGSRRGRGKKGRRNFNPRSDNNSRPSKPISDEDVKQTPEDSSVVISKENLNKKPKSDILIKLNKYYK